MYFVKTPKIFTKIFPDLVWKCPADRPELHLTFDDGPSENTALILDFLAERNIKASFFCLGQQVEKFPDVFQRIKDEGHVVGNHGYAHLDGWKTSVQEYVEDIGKASHLISSRLFRPPFGRLRYGQYQSLHQKYQIIMWSVMPGDFDDRISVETCKRRISKAEQTDIMVLHDHSDSKILELLQFKYQ